MMPKTRLIAISCATAFLSLAAITPASADLYTLDPMHTAIVWHINHFGFSNPSGKFMNVNGTLDLDQANPAMSRVEVTIPIGTIDSGIAKLDEHLKSKDFFDVANNPIATFVSDRVDVTGKDTAMVHGTLMLHGISQSVTLDVKLNKSGENMMKKQTVGFSATTTIKRSDFGITAYLPALGDEVRLDIETEANLAAPGAN